MSVSNESNNVKTVFALDTSASTKNVKNYWDRVEKKFAEYNKTEGIIYLAWDRITQEVSSSHITKEINQKGVISGGGTKPETLAKKIKEMNFQGHLVLITDGEIASDLVQLTDNELAEWKFESVDIELIGGRIDLSVTSPFTRHTKFTIHLNGEKLSEGRSNVVIDWENDYSTIDNFLQGYEELYSMVVTQNMGKNNQALKTTLLNIQKKLLAECAVRNKEGAVGTPVLQALQRGDYEGALALTKSAASSAMSNGLAKEISGKIQSLITACTSVGVYSLGLLQSSRFQRADPTLQVEVEKIEQLDTTDEKWECPIYYEEDIPALLILDIWCGNPILEGVPKPALDAIFNCPLYLLNFPELVAKVQQAIDHPIGCKSIALRADGLFEDSPMTRQRVLGAIPLGLDKSHVKSGDWTISRLFTGGKMIGNMQLWYAVLYFIIKQKVSYLNSNEEFMKSLTRQFKYRLDNFTSYMGLSGTGEYPLLRVPVSQAIWYCVASGYLYAEDDITQDRFRAFHAIDKYFLEILDMLEYPYDKVYTNHRLQLLTVWNHMMANKYGHQQTMDAIRSQYQNYLYLKNCNKIVFLDGSLADGGVQPYKLPEIFNGLSLEELLYLSNQVKPSVKAGDVVLPRLLPLSTVRIPTPSYNYVYKSDYVPSDIEICPGTLRPYSIGKNNLPWKDAASQYFGTLKDIISLKRHYMAYIESTKQYPVDKEQFYLYIQNKELNSIRQRNTLPLCLEKMFEVTDQQFKKAIEQISLQLNRPVEAKDLSERSQLSSNRIERLNIENQWLKLTRKK
ncbi:hypothetical protein DLAC_08527 [Tieghemostelium lacteum]|uniref:Uncharacterized protein n=1 Tax=Tieghemostelium lacteum TaxID=361077 RepID=A0A151Z7L4_TIELA|nr:hypothetical protein DLAC_08527 [Tieghemostelium lacteum]|eukprot:KYQ89956.1 hypothetical protein DLAC_08527 [Tieghemostelium lacteum]